MFGGAPLGAGPFAATLFHNFATVSAFPAILADGDFPLAFIVDAQVWDPAASGGAGALVERGYADHTLPLYFTDTTRNFPSLVNVSLISQNNLFTSLRGVTSGGASLSGSIELDFSDGTIDDLTSLLFDGRMVQVLAGDPKTFDFFQFQPVIRGTSADVTWDERRFVFNFRDPAELLQQDLQSVFFAGDDAVEGFEGGPDLKDKPKPIALGYPQNVEGIKVNNAGPVYVFHFDKIEEFLTLAGTGVFDKGSKLLPAPDPTGGPVDATAPAGDIKRLGFADLFDWTAFSDPPIGPSLYISDVANAAIRPGARPAGAITVDMHADDTHGQFLPSESIFTAGDLINRLMEIAGNPVVIEPGAVANLNSKNTAFMGFYQGAEPISVLAAIDRVIESVGGWRSFTREGNLNFDVFEFTTPVDTILEADILSISRVRTDAPALKLSLGYGQSFKVQDADAIAAGGDADRIAFASERFRRVISPNQTGQDAIELKHPTAKTLEIDTLYNVLAQAQAEVDRRAALITADRDRYDVRIRGRRFIRRPGETITLTFASRGWNISARDFIIVGVGESSVTLETTLRLWG